MVVTRCRVFSKMVKDEGWNRGIRRVGGFYGTELFSFRVSTKPLNIK